MSSLAPGLSPSFPSSLILVFTVFFLSHILTLLTAADVVQGLISPFLHTLSQKHYPSHWWALPWPAAGQSWSWLALTLLDTGEASGSFLQIPFLHPSPSKLWHGKKKMLSKRNSCSLNWQIVMLVGPQQRLEPLALLRDRDVLPGMLWSFVLPLMAPIFTLKQ